MKPIHELYAFEAAALIDQGVLSAEALTAACLERIEAREPSVGAWAFLDRELALLQARELDRRARRGPLHGIPVGVKDIFDTFDMPTEYGTPIYRGHRPAWDAACIAAARAAGAVILGKTVTTELAYFKPGKTRNPHNSAHTPGGSSSGSVAAVADFMVPLAFGTQTAGSVVRPASYCGIVGYKPSFGLVGRAGVKMQSDSLDTIGFFARCVRDTALLCAALIGRPALAASTSQPASIGICRTPEWRDAAPETIAALETAAAVLAADGARVSRVELPETFADIGTTQRTIMAFEDARNYAHEWRVHGERLSTQLRDLIEEGLACPPERYDAARTHAAQCRALIAEVFQTHDVLLAPSAPGEAPEGLASTGDPVFNRMWTLLGNPALNVPAGVGPRGLPVGLQVIGPLDGDADALAAAAWIEHALGACRT